jgi:hypothetical protein
MPPLTKIYTTEIKQIIKDVWAKDYNAVNYAMVEAYWLIGRRIKFPIRRSVIAIFSKKADLMKIRFICSVHIQRIMRIVDQAEC